MTLQWALASWHMVTGHVGIWPILVPLFGALLYECAAGVRNMQRYWTTRMVVREAPRGTVVRSMTRRPGGLVSTLVIEVGPPTDPAMTTSSEQRELP